MVPDSTSVDNSYLLDGCGLQGITISILIQQVGRYTMKDNNEYEILNYSTKLGEWICEDLWPAFLRAAGYCTGKILLGLLFGLGFWLAQYINAAAITYWRM